MRNPLEVIRSIFGADSWPPPMARDRWAELDKFVAFRDSLEVELRALASSKQMVGGDVTQAYLIVPLALRLARASANLLFGEAPQIKARVASDQERVTEIARRNNLFAELKAAAVTSASEGEVYAKVTVDPSTPRGRRVPLIEIISPRRIIPQFRGRELISCSIVLSEVELAPDSPGARVLRVLEHHTAQEITYTAYEGTGATKGTEVELDKYPEQTGHLEPVANPIGELLVVHVPNAISTDSPHGRSDLDGLDDFLLAVNEIFTLTQETYRASVPIHFLPESVFDDKGNLPAGVKAVPLTDDMVEIGAGRNRVEMVQPSFKSDGFKGYVEEVLDLIQLCSGISSHAMGRSDSQGVTHLSGSALKIRMATTLMEAASKSAFYQRAIEEVYRLAAKLDAVRVNGKQAVSWADDEDPVTVQLQDGIPQDDEATAHLLAALDDVLSNEDKLRFAFPDLTDDEIAEMIRRRSDEKEAEVQRMQDLMTAQTDPADDPSADPNADPSADAAAGE